MSDSFRDHQMLARARGSSYEVQTQLEIALNLEFISPKAFEVLIEKAGEVSRLLNGLIASIQRQIAADEAAPKPLRAKT